MKNPADPDHPSLPFLRSVCSPEEAARILPTVRKVFPFLEGLHRLPLASIEPALEFHMQPDTPECEEDPR
jgi:hypothetical protein